MQISPRLFMNFSSCFLPFSHPLAHSLDETGASRVHVSSSSHYYDTTLLLSFIFPMRAAGCVWDLIWMQLTSFLAFCGSNLREWGITAPGVVGVVVSVSGEEWGWLWAWGDPPRSAILLSHVGCCDANYSESCCAKSHQKFLIKWFFYSHFAGESGEILANRRRKY